MESFNLEINGIEPDNDGSIEQLNMGSREEAAPEKEEKHESAKDEAVVLPDIKVAEAGSSELCTGNIEEELQKDTISTVMLSKEDEFEYPAYMIDMRSIESIQDCIWEPIGEVVGDEGDTTVYIRLVDGITKIGKGDSEKLYSMMSVYIDAVFNGKCSILRNDGKGFKVIKGNDIHAVKLDFTGGMIWT